ncbi:hypothetical protein PN466_24290 [Roseofilum reptotaenium CS-1145]|uniref:Protein kinase domain-containing protein n=1 Tax=Roseofilum reptotaenium AO1-A TaxID=1925591 RepID=A0A1L9QJI6_9CYAN|nr:hypothetical protein [Roseofilum reptotaenium]MDB9520070.1 hypothetical protein [Roseofilum reptotaenium CS-1145]OJJ14256.1 hypothetical protein BI308_25105 [Roseofilum reptotaenium AO1-A]
MGAWSDVYSLAAVLYWLLTGVVPPSTDDRDRGKQTLKSVTELNPEISDRVKNAIEEGMKIKPDARPQTVKKWLNKLGGYRLSLDCFDSPKWGAVGAIAGIVAALGTVAGLYIAWMSWKNSTPSPQVEPTPNQLKIKN